MGLAVVRHLALTLLERSVASYALMVRHQEGGLVIREVFCQCVVYLSVEGAELRPEEELRLRMLDLAQLVTKAL